MHTFGPPLGSQDTRTAAQRRMDGLTAACQAALNSGTAGTRHGAAPHLSILVDEQTLAGAAGTGTGRRDQAGQAGQAGQAEECPAAARAARPATAGRTGRPARTAARTGPARPDRPGRPPGPGQ